VLSRLAATGAAGDAGIDADSIEVDVLTGPDEMEAYREQWERLYAQSNASAYSCYDWLRLVFDHDEADEDLRICALRDRLGLFAIVPLLIRRHGRFSAELRFVGGGWSPCNTAILSPRCSGFPVLAPVFDHLRRRSRDWHYARLNRLPLGSPLVIPANSAINNGGAGRTVYKEYGASVVIVLPESWEAYAGELSPHRVKTVNRHTAVMRRRGELRLVRLGLDPGVREAPLDALIQDALAVARASWQASAKEGRAICDADTEDLFVQASHRMARRGMLDLSVLYLDERPVSFIWGLARHPESSILKLGFDSAVEKLSPGQVHLAELIKDSIGRGLREIDFGHECSEYKVRWSRHRRVLHQMIHFRHRWFGPVRSWLGG
jgi:CelD/BcsL family acetyltransferase involved in cellulose biosynthesis